MRYRRVGTLLVVLSLALPGSACISYDSPLWALEGSVDSPALGTVELSSDLVGDHKLAPTRCKAGDEQFFLGGDFIDDAAGITLRLVVDPLEGPAVRVFATGEPFVRSVAFRRAECSVFHMSLGQTGLTINDVEMYRISLDVDCSNADGTSLRGKLDTESCN